jgi:hypothetical protein
MARRARSGDTEPANRNASPGRKKVRTAADETTGGGGGARGGRPRGTATRSRVRTTSESTGEVDETTLPPGPPRAAGGRGRGSKTDAPRSRGTTSGRGSTGARKSVNRPGASGSPKKK